MASAQITADPQIPENTVWVIVKPGPSLVVTPPVLPVTGQYTLITFELKVETVGTWVFPSTGAVVMVASSAQFPLIAWTDQTPNKVMLFDFNSDSDEYHYSVYVRRLLEGDSDPGLPSILKLEIDPAIQNGQM